MDYRHFDIEDFVMDSSFQNYCLGTREKDILFWKSWIRDHPGKYEKVRQARELFILLNGNNSITYFRQDEQAFRSILNKHLRKEEEDTEGLQIVSGRSSLRSKKRRRLFLYAGGIAASFLLVLMVSYFWITRQQDPLKDISQVAKLTYTSLPGERKSFQLSDGSTVLLNAGSTISISESFNVNDREISLEGEAYFNVTHNAQKPFIIHTHNINVKVLGTEFDVKAYPKDRTTEAILIRGSVEVTVKSSPDKKIILKPHHKFVIENGVPSTQEAPDSVAVAVVMPKKIKVETVLVNAKDSSVLETSWTENRLNFSDESLAEVATKLERWYGVKVDVEKDIAQQYKFTGTFENETISETLKALQLSLFFNYRIEGGKIFITK